jgi:hypothetical protein
MEFETPDNRDDDQLSGPLARSIASLREPVPVREDWRAELLARVERDQRPAAGWRLRPSLAIAAGIILILSGVIVGRAWPTRPPRTVSTAPAATTAKVRFVFVAPGAAHVSVVGDFNQWNAESMPLRRLGDGTWIVDVPLAPGQYAYAFVVDGKVVVDPTAPRAESDFGENSIVMVRGS